MDDPVTDTWLVGVVAHDDALCGMRVHAGFVAYGPSSGRGDRLQIRLRYGAATAAAASPAGASELSAFPNEEESADLIDWEDHLVGLLDADAVLVAVLTTPGYRDLIFHTAQGEACRGLVAKRGTLNGDDASVAIAEVDVFGDPAWSLYRSLFTDAVPADADRRKIAEQPATSGELLVAHRFLFASIADADQAAAALRDVGLDVVAAPAAKGDPSASARFEVIESEDVSEVSLARSRDALGGFAASWGGVYEGWDPAG